MIGKIYPRDKWSKQEIDLLIQNYLLKNNKILAIELNKSINAINKKACRLKLKKVFWTSMQESYLKKNYKTKTIKELAEYLKKTEDSIAQRLSKLKLIKSPQELSIIFKRIPKKYTKGKDHWNYNGGRTKDKYGYIWIKCPNHPYATKPHGFIREHRLVVERFIGRYLTSKEVVHHLDEKKGNNNINNLMIFPTDREHIRWHRKLKQYGYITKPMQRIIDNRWDEYLK